MNTENKPITVKILNREYRVACPSGEEDALIESARQLDLRMQEIKQTGKVVGTDRVAVMAALNIINELMSSQPKTPASNQNTNQIKSELSAQIGSKIENMQSKIDQQLSQL